MMTWMITLEEEYCNAILEGRKEIEIRTRIPRTLDAGDIIQVCMKGSKGRVPFFFVVDCVVAYSPRALWVFNKHQLAIDEKDYLEYTKGQSVVYALHISYVYRHKRLFTISDFGVRKAPQWFTEVVV